MKRNLLMGIHLLVAAGAIPAGLLMLASPKDGLVLGLQTRWLEGSPFGTFLIPGLYLLIAIGAGNLAAALAQVQRAQNAALGSFFGGLALGVFEVVQLMLVPFSALQPICLFLAIAMMLLTAPDLGLEAPGRRPRTPGLHDPIALRRIT